MTNPPDQPPSHYDIARGILVSVIDSSKAPTRHERIEVAQLAATLALIDELRHIETDIRGGVRIIATRLAIIATRLAVPSDTRIEPPETIDDIPY